MRVLHGEPPITVFSMEPLNDVTDGNVDFEVSLGEGSRWSGTVFTVDNLRSLMAKWQISGEHSGLYIAAPDMLVVERLSDEVLRAVVDDLVASGEVQQVLRKLDDIAT